MSLQEIQLAADELPVAIWMGKVPTGDVVYINRAFREVLGIEPPAGAARGAFVEPYGVHLPDGSKYPENRMPFERAIRARETVVVDDLVIHRRDGRRVYLRVFAKPLFDDLGELTHVLEAFTDITREVEAERARAQGDRRLARSQRLESIGQLVAGIAHDFNNLLTVTKLAVSQLLASEKDDAKRDALGDVETVTDSAIALVKNLLGFAGRQQQVLAPTDVVPIAESVVELARRTFDRRINLRLEGDPSAWLRGDRTQIEQVLMNLLVNARDAITGAGHVTVSFRTRELAAGEIEGCAPGKWIVLEVTDDGSGIDPAIRDRIFEPYFTTKSFGPVKGTGLGLSTVHGIVQAHHGAIEALSHAPRGTTLRVALPACDPLASESRPASARKLRASTGAPGRLVLVVDDERLVRAATARTLESLGWHVLEAEGGEAALELFDRHAKELAAVVLDMIMPGMPPRDVLAAMFGRRADVPVLVVTGTSMSDEVRALLEAGVRGCLAKPFDDEQLADALASIVD
ncbi:MAG TPA: ATP-binding protein [Labilithrix sp.]|jgi:PAS domain S-box-containing protein